jgi:hypothetical protein
MTDDPTTLRPITPKALRRSWHEPFVRAWWLSAAVLFVVILWVFVDQYSEAQRGRYRIAHWQRVDAIIRKIGPTARAAYRPTLDQLRLLPVALTYQDTAGESHDLEGKLEAQTVNRSPGETIPILIDPAKRDRWTDRIQPLPLIEELMAPTILLPLPILCALVGYWQRGRVLKLWQKGTLRQGIIVARKISATAPGSAVLGCTIEGSRDKRLLNVCVPRGATRFDSGDTIAIVTQSGDAGRAIAVMLYE